MADDLDDLESDLLGDDTDLPSQVDTDVSSSDDGMDAATLGKWVVGAGGAVVAAVVLYYLFFAVVGLVGFALKAGAFLLVAYLLYRGVAWMLSDSDSSGLEQTQMPESTGQETEALLDEDQLNVEGGDELSIDDSEISLDEDELSVSEEDLSVDESDLETSDLEDSDLEEEFAELERELQNES